MRAFLVVLAACAAAGFNTGAAPLRSALAPRAAIPSMQFFNPKKDGRDVYDDEVDTTGNRGYQPNFVENGEVDLANVGGELYLAFVPFLLFFFAYASGAFNFGYSQGNF